jgi:hypothetical protein
MIAAVYGLLACVAALMAELNRPGIEGMQTVAIVCALLAIAYRNDRKG